MAKTPVIIGGQKVGRLKASWLLFKESWRFLRADKEMLAVPIIVGIVQIVLFGILVALFISGGLFFGESAVGAEDNTSWFEYVFLFMAYLLGALSLAFSQAVITHIVYIRVHSGNATLGDGLRAAWARFGALLVWSLITSTVGMVLRAIAERSPLLGKIVVMLIGAAWNVTTYFVVPTIMIQKLEAVPAIKTSARTFIATWGETLVSNVTLGAIFLLAHVLVFLSFIGLVVSSFALDVPGLVYVWFGLYFVWLVGAVLINAVLQSILQTLLFVYATEHHMDNLNFNSELLENMLVRKGGSADNPRIPPTENLTPVSPVLPPSPSY